MEATSKNRNKYFTAWCFFVQPWGIDPFLGDSTTFNERVRFATGFGAMVRKGELGLGNEIKVGSVRTAINAIAQIIAFERDKTPLHNNNGDYHLGIK